MQNFTVDQIHAMNKGAIQQQTLKNHITEALTNNPFKKNYIFSSEPGLGKTYETHEVLKTITDTPLIIEGNGSVYTLMIDLATALYLLPKGQHLRVILDDCDILFEAKNLNTAKKMFDKTKAFKYNKNFRSLQPFCNDIQFEALESFSSPNHAGISIPLDNVTFLILTNRHLATVNEVDALDQTSAKFNVLTDAYSIRRRTNYKEITMEPTELWGYVANTTLNSQICEKIKPTITVLEKEQILNWCYMRWTSVTERNLSLIEKMTEDMVRYPKNYLDIWQQNYV